MARNDQTNLPLGVFRSLVADRKAHARTAVETLPQYAGHFDGPEWTLLRAKTEIKTKLGIAAVKGEIVLGKIEVRDLGEGPEPRVVFWSRSNVCNTIVDPKNFDLVSTRRGPELQETRPYGERPARGIGAYPKAVRA